MIRLMVIPGQVQQPMQQKNPQFGFELMSMRVRLPYGRIDRNGQISGMDALKVRGREGKNVGRSILVAKRTIQPSDFRVRRHQHGQLSLYWDGSRRAE